MHVSVKFAEYYVYLTFMLRICYVCPTYLTFMLRICYVYVTYILRISYVYPTYVICIFYVKSKGLVTGIDDKC